MRGVAWALAVLSIIFHAFTYGFGTIAGSLEHASNDLMKWLD